MERWSVPILSRRHLRRVNPERQSKIRWKVGVGMRVFPAFYDPGYIQAAKDLRFWLQGRRDGNNDMFQGKTKGYEVVGASWGPRKSRASFVSGDSKNQKRDQLNFLRFHTLSFSSGR